MSLSNNFPNQSPTLLLDFANARALDPRITFARNTTGVYYDGITTALAEQNLLVQSQSLAAGTWGVAGMSLSDNAAVAPDGTTTATRITETAVTSEHYASQTLTTFPGGAFVFSCYLKKGTLATAPDWAQLACGGTNSGYVSVNLATGVIGNTGGFTSTAIQNVGSGWYRVSVTSTVAGGAISFRIGTTNNTNAATRHVTYLGSVTSDVLAWGAQVENRATLTAYTPTTTAIVTNYVPALLTAAVNTARFTANPVTGASLGLLMEIGRTNLALYSADFGNAAWSKNNTSVTTDTIVAPDGTITGDAIVENTAVGAYHSLSQSIVKATSAITYTYTVYAKSSNRSIGLRLAETSPGTSGAVVAYNLATGAIETTAGTYGTTFTNASSTITAVGNGWYRVSLTVTSGPETSLQMQVYMQNGGTSVYTGNGFSGIFVWGAQLEEGAFATSYIATTTVAVPRGEETAAMTGANFTSWFNNGEGTFYIESTFEYQGASNFPRLVAAVGTSPGTDEIAISTRTTGVGAGAGQTLFSTTVAGTGVGEIFPSGQTVLGSTNAAFAYKLNDLAASVFRIPVEVDTTATIPACVALRIYGRSRFQQPPTGIVKKIAYYDTRLPNAQLATLTAN
jgi:hypothetical protein